MPRKKYQIGDKVYSPFRRPKAKISDGARWIVVERHVEKGYPIRWRLIEGEISEHQNDAGFQKSGLEGATHKKGDSAQGPFEGGRSVGKRWFPTFIDMSQPRGDKD